MTANVDFACPEYKRSRAAYAAQATIEYLVSLLITDAFLAKLLLYLGIDDAMIGIISSVISFAFLVQLLSIPLMKHVRHIKRTVMIFDSLSVIVYTMTYILPFLHIGKQLCTVLVFGCIVGGAFMKYMVFTVLFGWANSFVHPARRGGFTAVKEMVSLGSGILFSLSVGAVVDRFEAADNMRGGFIFIAIVMAVLTAGDMASILLIKDREQEATASGQKSLREVALATFGSKPFRCLLVTQCLYSIASYMITGFLGTFKTVELAYTVGTIQVFNTLGCLARFGLSRPMGRYSDKTSFARGYSVGLIGIAVSFICCALASPDCRWMIIVFTVLYNAAMSATVGNTFNMTFSYVPVDCIAQAQAIKSSISGVLGFFASLAGSAILRNVQGNGNMLFGIHVYGQQVLALVACAITVLNILFVQFVLKKQKVLQQ